MNNLVEWAKNNLFVWNEINGFTGIEVMQGDFDRQFGGPTASKVLGYQFPSAATKPDANITTYIGGICSLATWESDSIRRKEITFDDIGEFEQWYQSWYPRLDMIMDAVGVPPMCAKEIVIVCEDSIFGRRIARQTSIDNQEILNAQEIAAVIKKTQQLQGTPCLERFIRSFGVNSNVRMVFTSDLERELDTALDAYSLLSGVALKRKGRDRHKVELMYTPLWPRILGINGPAVIYEPAHHFGVVSDGIASDQVYSWFQQEPFGQGKNTQLGMAGFIPCVLNGSFMKNKPLMTVPHFNNWRDYTIQPNNAAEWTLNLLFNNKRVMAEGPETFPAEKVGELVSHSLKQYYGGR